MNSATSILIAWTRLSTQTLAVTKYTLYVDDGFGVTFTKVFEYDYTEF